MRTAEQIAERRAAFPLARAETAAAGKCWRRAGELNETLTRASATAGPRRRTSLQSAATGELEASLVEPRGRSARTVRGGPRSVEDAVDETELVEDAAMLVQRVES